MKFIKTHIDGCFIIQPVIHEDSRGWFTRIFCAGEFSEMGIHKPWVQINHSFTRTKGTIRGMHFQLAPHEEVKLIRCISGAVRDVVVDLRKDSATFLQHFSEEISAENKLMICIPEGCAHGFQSLENDTQLIYHHSNYYVPGAEGGLHYNDPLLQISWPLPVSVVSDRDLNHPFLQPNFKGI